LGYQKGIVQDVKNSFTSKAPHNSVVNTARDIQIYFNNAYEKAEEVQCLAKVKQYLKDILAHRKFITSQPGSHAKNV
jgi:hypothetical protein